MTATMSKRKPVKLSAAAACCYAGRDEDGTLCLYSSLPTWTGFDFVPSRTGERVARLPEEWFPELVPGRCVRLSPERVLSEAASPVELSCSS